MVLYFLECPCKYLGLNFFGESLFNISKKRDHFAIPPKPYPLISFPLSKTSSPSGTLVSLRSIKISDQRRSFPFTGAAPVFTIFSAASFRTPLPTTLLPASPVLGFHIASNPQPPTNPSSGATPRLCRIRV